MDAKLIIALSVLEAVALLMIARLWFAPRRHVSVVSRALWSLLLLVPGFGLLVYEFIHSDPEEHPDYAEDSGWDVGGGDGD